MFACFERVQARKLGEDQANHINGFCLNQMLGKLKLTILTLSTLIVAYAFVGLVTEKASAGDEAYRDLAVFTKVVDHVQQDYVEPPDMNRAMKGALHGMLEALDPFSSYVDRETFARLSTGDRTAGVGLALSKRYGYVYVVAVDEGSPAEQSGLRSGDLVDAIDGNATILMSLWEAERSLLGQPGTTVNLRVIRTRRSEPQELALERKDLATPAPTARLMDGQAGYLRIAGFEPGVAEGVRARLKVLASSGMKGLLIDLRSSARGSWEEAAAAADLFLGEGLQIAEIRGQKGDPNTFRSTSDIQFEGLPLVLLVDGGTSGPAEVFATALRDHGVAEVVGERTNGRGSVQREFRLSEGDVLMISTGMVFRAGGAPLQHEEIRKSGLNPDLAAPERDFITNFFFEQVADLDEENPDEGVYTRLDEAVKKRQVEMAVERLRQRISESASATEKNAA